MSSLKDGVTINTSQNRLACLVGWCSNTFGSVTAVSDEMESRRILLRMGRYGPRPRMVEGIALSTRQEPFAISAAQSSENISA